HARAWPILHKPLSELMRPTRGTYEAVHPLALARPTPVHGLVALAANMRSTLDGPRGRYVVVSNEREAWAFRSRDQGINWTPTSVNQSALDGHAGHCMADAGAIRVGLAAATSGSRPALLVGSLTGMGVERRDFGTPNEQVLRLACDATGAVVLARRKADPLLHVYSCAMSGRCRELGLPAFFSSPDVFMDVARVNRTIVVAAARDGLVRVTTSRDEGATLTPPALVFDARGAAGIAIEAPIVPHLFGFEKQVELVLSNPSGSRSWALLSNDAGASFHAFE
ncbi:MAG TPA: hypothetical protein VIV60_18400, partial [Polyangiaceae bacterium]